jgi:3-methyladenine DNA glycosylase/8-oxoguanine DNA glycosylase
MPMKLSELEKRRLIKKHPIDTKKTEDAIALANRKPRRKQHHWRRYSSIYIWAYYYATEKPDMKRISGLDQVFC